jgi:hypothetical protein
MGPEVGHGGFQSYGRLHYLVRLVIMLIQRSLRHRESKDLWVLDSTTVVDTHFASFCDVVLFGMPQQLSGKVVLSNRRENLDGYRILKRLGAVSCPSGYVPVVTGFCLKPGNFETSIPSGTKGVNPQLKMALFCGESHSVGLFRRPKK